jgi:hypothetical protein
VNGGVSGGAWDLGADKVHGAEDGQLEVGRAAQNGLPQHHAHAPNVRSGTVRLLPQNLEHRWRNRRFQVRHKYQEQEGLKRWKKGKRQEDGPSGKMKREMLTGRDSPREGRFQDSREGGGGGG